ncbi:hypothetical protein [Caulobacter sp.]|uniref:hypothetical protein n=1 Tax=Caulobacter sp. TaxID=78 RepID=UPI001B099308|nr:hypothetical protein [Caulobacter sp.]MBO9543796.1 hypothetical protein [Caulobacter sp.]
MSAFEFFFSFYGLVLGFSAAELAGGFAGLVQRRRTVRFGYLTVLLAAFVAIDIATFWAQAWTILRFAPFNFALLILGLVVAITFYVAASLVFAKDPPEGAHLDEHFWENRRIVLLCVLAANLVMVAVLTTLTLGTGEFGAINRPMLWIGLAIFTTFTLIAALAKKKGVVTAALVILLLYHGQTITRSAALLVKGGGWTILQSKAPKDS